MSSRGRAAAIVAMAPGASEMSTSTAQQLVDIVEALLDNGVSIEDVRVTHVPCEVCGARHVQPLTVPKGNPAEGERRVRLHLFDVVRRAGPEGMSLREAGRRIGIVYDHADADTVVVVPPEHFPS